MAVKKTYQVAGNAKLHTLSLKLNVEVERGEEIVVVPREITMKGSLHPVRKKGTYSTSDPAIIKAMDKRIDNALRSGHKPDFLELREINIPDAEAQKTPEVVETKDGVKFADDLQPGEKAKIVQMPPQAVGGISTVQEAKEYLIKNFDVSTRDVSNKDKVTRMAAEKNVNFVDLK